MSKDGPSTMYTLVSVVWAMLVGSVVGYSATRAETRIKSDRIHAWVLCTHDHDPKVCAEALELEFELETMYIP